MSPPCNRSKTIDSYNAIAADYAAHFFDELDRKPFDRQLLDRFVQSLPPGRPVCDLGCGPGHVGRYLRARGIGAFGLDLSRGMTQVARRRNPGVDFCQADMRRLPIAGGVLGGVVAFYSIIHLPRGAVAYVAGEIARVLTAGGSALVAFHVGDGEVHADEMCGRPVDVDATLFAADEIAAAVRSAGLVVSETATRPPYDFEYPSQRAYVWASKSAIAT